MAHDVTNKDTGVGELGRLEYTQAETSLCRTSLRTHATYRRLNLYRPKTMFHNEIATSLFRVSPGVIYSM